ncbi:hypothetical protein ACJJTC_011497 [Scirpophaga incertulas]
MAPLYGWPYAIRNLCLSLIATTSTCLHHSQLEISPGPYVERSKLNPVLNTEPVKNQHQDGRVATETDNSAYNNCQRISLKKRISLSTLYKPTHNKSETGHKQKSCPLHKKKMSNPEPFSSFASDQLIKTY